MKKLIVLCFGIVLICNLGASDNGSLCRIVRLSEDVAEKVFFFNPELSKSYSLFEFSIVNESKMRTLTIFPSRLPLPKGALGLVDCMAQWRPSLRAGGYVLVAYELTRAIMDRGLFDCPIDKQAATYLRAALPVIIGPSQEMAWPARGAECRLFPKHRYVSLLAVPKKEEPDFIKLW
ncbi:MAG: hypothetical protein QG632_557, partial [Candidatus Dependentiae bacterium]|nr:hypothetical protein [Candidatus Dependentiae bacterium]